MMKKNLVGRMNLPVKILRYERQGEIYTCPVYKFSAGIRLFHGDIYQGETNLFLSHLNSEQYEFFSKILRNVSELNPATQALLEVAN